MSKESVKLNSFATDDSKKNYPFSEERIHPESDDFRTTLQYCCFSMAQFAFPDSKQTAGKVN